VISPDRTEGNLWLHQDAWFSLGKFDAGKTVDIRPKAAGIGSYLFVLSGELEIAGETLGTRDAIGLSDYAAETIKVTKPAEFLLIDVPMLQ
jgi:hypothetical protein